VYRSAKNPEFNPTKFDDRYDAVLVELIERKSKGRPIQATPRPSRESNVVDS
jgi:DNA end-binding protein Ku